MRDLPLLRKEGTAMSEQEPGAVELDAHAALKRGIFDGGDLTGRIADELIEAYRTAVLGEREALLARLVSTLETTAEVFHNVYHCTGTTVTPWRECDFNRCEVNRAALAAARAVAPDPWGCPECRMGFHQHTETCSRAVAP